MLSRPFRRRVSGTDGDLTIRKPPPVVRRHSSVEVVSPQLPPIPRVSPLLNANEQDRLAHSDDSTAASSRYSGGSSLLGSTSDGALARGRYGSADEGTVLTMASSNEEEADKRASPPSTAQRLAVPTQPKEIIRPDTLQEAWFVSPALAPGPLKAVVLAGEDGNDADADEDEDGIVYVDDESSDEEEAPAAAVLEDDLVPSCGCDGTAATRLPPPIVLPGGQRPWLLPRRETFDSGDGRAASAMEEDENDPALLEAERILLTTPEPTEPVFASPRSSAYVSPRNVFPVSPTKRPSLPLPDLPLPTLERNKNVALNHTPHSHGAVERGLERLVLGGDSDDDGDGDETEVEAVRRRIQPPRVALASAPARPPRKRPNKLQKRRRSSSAGVSEGEGRPKKPTKPPFDRFSFPTEEGLATALDCEIATELGESVKFGDMLRARSHDKVIVIFLRHAWCGLCQQYVEALNRASLNLVSVTGNMFAGLGDRTTTSRIAPLDVVLINSSTPALIGPYRERHHTPFPLYSDRHRKLYKALGMTRKTWSMGKEADKGSYIVKSQMQNVTSSISAGVNMPKYPGSQTQLGGEFVFEHDRATDTLKCLFVSRMHTTRAHAEIRDVFAAAGVELDEQDARSVYGL